MEKEYTNGVDAFKRSILILAAIAVLLGIAALIGWASDLPILTGAYDHEIPMAPNTAVEFVLLGLVLFACALRPGNRMIFWAGLIVILLVALASIASLTQYLTGSDWGIDKLVYHDGMSDGAINAGRQSPMTALAFLALAASLTLLLAVPHKSLTVRTAASLLALLVLPLALVVTVGYIFGTPLLYGANMIPMALTTSIALACLCVGMIMRAGRESWPLRLMVGPSLRAQLLRTFLPLTAFMIIFEGWIISVVIHEHSTLNLALLSSIVAVTLLVFAFALITGIAKSIGGAVDRAHDERIRAELRLRDNIHLLETIFENTQVLIAYLDRDMNFIRVNRAYAAADEREPSFFPGKNHFALFPNEENQQIFEGVARTGEPYIATAKPFEYAEHPERGVSYWDWSLVPVKNEDDEVESLILTLVNVTERIWAEEEVRISGAYNRSLIEASLDPLVTINPEGKVTDVNKSTELVTGLPREELIGTDFSEYFSEPEKARSGYRKVLRDGEVHDYELQLRHVDGHLTPVVYNASLYRDEAGEVAGIFAAARDISERKRAEEITRNSEARLKEAQRLAHLGHWELDIVNNDLSWSDEVYRIFGLKPQEFGATYEAFLEHVHPEDRDYVNQAYTDSLKQKTGYDIEHRVWRKDGAVRTVNERCDTIFNEAGEPLRSVGTVLDITELKKAEDELRRSNRALTVLSECNETLVRARDESVLLNEVCRILVETGGYLMGWIGFAEHDEGKSVRPVASFGYAQDYLDKARITWRDTERGRGPTGIAIRENHPAVLQHIRTSEEYAPWRDDALRLGYESSAALPLVINDEVIGSLQVYSGEPDAFRESEIELLGELASDLSYGVQSLRTRHEHDLAEKELIASEGKYRNLFEKSKEAILIMKADGRLVDVNPAGLALFGFDSFAELKGKDITSAIFENAEDVNDLIALLLEQGFIKDSEVTLKRKDGQKIYAMVTADIVRDDDGEPLYFNSILHDMTEHRKLEEQLLRAQKLESVGRLAGGLAHDFNNFLTAVKGFLDLSKQEVPPDSPALEDLAEAGKAVDRATALTRQLLIFSRRESLAVKPVDLNAVVRDILGMLGTLIGERYSIVLDLSDTMPRVNGDAGHLEQVVMNLVVNSRDAMPGGGEIRIGTVCASIDEGRAASRPDSQPGRYACLSVSDDGCGMDEETLSHIFEPFFSSKPGRQGTGLGLSTVFGIVKQHGGWIEVESSPGEGSTFTVFLPEMERGEVKEEEVGSRPAAAAGHGEKVLVVEDEEAVRTFAVKVLEKQGYQVVSAASAEQALEIFRRQKDSIDFVFSDVILPGETGVWLAERIREESPGTPLLLASGYYQLSEQETIKQKGYPFIAKPYSREDLLAFVGAQVQESRDS